MCQRMRTQQVQRAEVEQLRNVGGMDLNSYQRNWPPNLVTSASKASEKDAKVIRELLSAGHTEELIDIMDELLKKKDLYRALRVAVRLQARFVHNCRRRKKLT